MSDAGSLPGTEQLPGGLRYDSSSSHTSVAWVDGDGQAPPEILVEHVSAEEGENGAFVLAFDPATETYSRKESVPPLGNRNRQVYLYGSTGHF